MGNNKTKLSKWEENYNNYDVNVENNIIQELEQKMNDKTITKEEYNELEKRKKVRDNIGKVRNILQLREKLIEQKDKIKAELQRRENLEEASKKTSKIETELEEIVEQIDTKKAALKDKDLSEEQKEKLNKELSELLEKRNKNNDEFTNNQQILLDNKDKGYSDLSKEDLQKEAFELSGKISKCNFAAKNLMNGLSWDSIVVKFDKWQDKTYKAPKKITENARKENSSKNLENSKTEIDLEELENNIISEGERIIRNDEEHGLVPQSKFAEKHPRLAKIGRFIKEKWANVFGKKEDKEDKEEELEDKESPVGDNKREDFVEYLREVSEKGLDKRAQERLKEAKAKAHERETEKFGKEYADRSVNIEEDERGR